MPLLHLFWRTHSGKDDSGFRFRNDDAASYERHACLFPGGKAGAAMGMFGLVIMAAPAIGPTLSGWVVEHYSWRTLFEIILPFAVLALTIGFFKLKILPQTAI